MSNSVVIPIQGRMSETDFDRARTLIRETYGDNRREAGIRWEQELALLFYHSHWTQEQLAAKEGKSRSYIDQRLRFGRFLAVNSNVSTDRGNLTEWEFRKLWDQTDKDEPNENVRFRDVARLLAESAQTNAEQRAANPALATIRRDYIDGKWHKAEKIAAEINQPIDIVKKALAILHSRPSTKFKSERRGGALSYTYRFFSTTEKTVSTGELTEKLTPLIGQLRSQAKTNMATVAISVFGKVAAELQQLLDEWGR